MADVHFRGSQTGYPVEPRQQLICGSCPYRNRPLPPRLRPTARQRSVLSCIANDWTDERIAKLLQLSDRQVRREIAAMCETLGVSGRVQLVATALRLGILPWSALEP